ncbi:MAG: hypothetical protein WD602_06840 [Actinomycetota bacterium]
MTAFADTVEASFGEALTVNERLVLSPCSGRFRPAGSRPSALEGQYVMEGEVVGSVTSPDGEDIPVQSRFAGWMMGYMLPPGAPVRDYEPVLWLRRH